jgi:hypothetical protein
MTFTLYSAIVPNYLQTLHAVSGLLDKAESHCAEREIAPDDLIQARLAADMLPFAYQVKSTVVHSLGSIEGVRRGSFSPDVTPPPETFAALKLRVSEASTAIEAIDPAEINSFLGRDMRFELGSRPIDFTAEDFLLSFSLPNFYFHASTTYDILRWKGLPIGKRDFIGRIRRKK